MGSKCREIQGQSENGQQLKRIIESIEDGFYVINDEWRITYWNKIAEGLFNKKKEEALGKKIEDIIPDAGSNDHFHYYQKVMNDRESLSYDTFYEQAKKWFSVNVYPCGEGISVFLKDISVKKKAEEERQQLIHELVQKNEHLRKYTYITSHNLREPVTNLQSLLSLIHIRPIRDAEAQEILQDCRRSVEELNATIDDLNQVIIIQDRSISVEQEKLLFENVFRSVLRQEETIINQIKISIEYNFQEVPSVMFNRQYLESIFANLLINSVHFRSQNRELRLTVHSREEDGHILLTFSDNGIGLDLKKHQDIFGMYQRFHEHAGGKGLGLFWVKEQIEALGGSITIESEIDKGMTVLMRFKKSKEAIPK